MFVVDSGEKSLFETLDLMGIDYKIEEIRFYFCKKCDKIYKKKVEICDCGGEIESIRAGDITNEERSFLIERKMGEDLYSSLDDRIYDQLEKLSSLFSGNVSLVFEGDLETLCSEHPKRANQLLSLPATVSQYNISWINIKDTVTLVKMLKFFDYKSKTPPKIRAKRFHYHELLPKKMLMFMGIKGVGMKMALKLSQKYRSITDYGNDIRLRGPTNVAKSIPGLGEKGVKNHALWVC